MLIEFKPIGLEGSNGEYTTNLDKVTIKLEVVPDENETVNSVKINSTGYDFEDVTSEFDSETNTLTKEFTLKNGSNDFTAMINDDEENMSEYFVINKEESTTPATPTDPVEPPQEEPETPPSGTDPVPGSGNDNTNPGGTTKPEGSSSEDSAEELKVDLKAIAATLAANPTWILKGIMVEGHPCPNNGIIYGEYISLEGEFEKKWRIDDTFTYIVIEKEINRKIDDNWETMKELAVIPNSSIISARFSDTAMFNKKPLNVPFGLKWTLINEKYHLITNPIYLNQ